MLFVFIKKKLFRILDLQAEIVLIPHVKAVLRKESGIGYEEEVVYEVIGGGLCIEVEVNLCRPRHDGFRDNQANKVAYSLPKVCSVPEEEPAQVLKLADSKVRERTCLATLLA